MIGVQQQRRSCQHSIGAGEDRVGCAGVGDADLGSRVEGPSRAGYATNISLEAITFTGTSRTVLRDHIYPSSGDWAIHPGGALFVENAEAVNVTGCNFSRTGGNAVYLSRHTSQVSIVDNSFRYIGESGVASVGATQLADGTAPTFPTGTLVARNYFIDLGIFGKQVSCYFHALSANATVTDNVCVNIPTRWHHVQRRCVWGAPGRSEPCLAVQCACGIPNFNIAPLLFKMAENLDLRCVLVSAPWVLGPKHVSNPE